MEERAGKGREREVIDLGGLHGDSLYKLFLETLRDNFNQYLDGLFLEGKHDDPHLGERHCAELAWVIRDAEHNPPMDDQMRCALQYENPLTLIYGEYEVFDYGSSSNLHNALVCVLKYAHEGAHELAPNRVWNQSTGGQVPAGQMETRQHDGAIDLGGMEGRQLHGLFVETLRRNRDDLAAKGPGRSAVWTGDTANIIAQAEIYPPTDEQMRRLLRYKYPLEVIREHWGGDLSNEMANAMNLYESLGAQPEHPLEPGRFYEAVREPGMAEGNPQAGKIDLGALDSARLNDMVLEEMQAEYDALAKRVMEAAGQLTDYDRILTEIKKEPLNDNEARDLLQYDRPLGVLHAYWAKHTAWHRGDDLCDVLNEMLESHQVVGPERYFPRHPDRFYAQARQAAHERDERFTLSGQQHRNGITDQAGQGKAAHEPGMGL